MLFDIGWPELMLIGVIALVVIGPKDLPRAMRVAGFWIRKARSLSREFQNSVDQMIREAELEDVRNDLRDATQFDIDHEIHNTIDPTGELHESIRPPEIPDHFEEEPLLPGIAEAGAEAPAALPAPEEEPLPEQPSLPFDAVEPVPVGGAQVGDARVGDAQVGDTRPAPDREQPQPQPTNHG